MKHYQHQKITKFIAKSLPELNEPSPWKCYFSIIISEFNFSTVPNKQFFRVNFLAGLRGQLFNSQTMYKIKVKLPYNQEKLFCNRMELVSFKYTLPLAKLDIVGSRPLLNGLIFSDDIMVDIQLVTFLLLPNIRELSIGAKTRKF